jgi:predicted acylesterase/phospholipase RssA
MEYDLVFEGGGAKGVAFVGALQAFERHGHKPRRLIGTSAGSITACLIAAGYSAQEALEAIVEVTPEGKPRFTTFMDTPSVYNDVIVKDQLGPWLRTELNNPAIPDMIEPMVDKLIASMIEVELIRHLTSLFLWGGWYAGDEFIRWLQEKLNVNNRCLADTTLEEFNQKTGRDLSVVASDLTGNEMLVLNHRTAPMLPTVWAVRMSMSFPFAWQEVIWRKEWGTYRGRNLEGDRVIDGGLLSNFPISYFVAIDENIDEIMGEGNQTENVIGLLIDESLEVPGAGDAPSQSKGGPGLIDQIDLLEAMKLRIYGLTNTVLSAHDKAMLSAYKNLICHLPAKGIGTLEFDMTPERREAVRQAGEAAMDAFLMNTAAANPIPVASAAL